MSKKRGQNGNVKEYWEIEGPLMMNVWVTGGAKGKRVKVIFSHIRLFQWNLKVGILVNLNLSWKLVT